MFTRWWTVGRRTRVHWPESPPSTPPKRRGPVGDSGREPSRCKTPAFALRTPQYGSGMRAAFLHLSPVERQARILHASPPSPGRREQPRERDRHCSPVGTGEAMRVVGLGRSEDWTPACYLGGTGFFFGAASLARVLRTVSCVASTALFACSSLRTWSPATSHVSAAGSGHPQGGLGVCEPLPSLG